MMFNLCLLFCLLIRYSSGGKQCDDATEVYTGDVRVSWEAKIDGVPNSDILAPKDVPVFRAENVVEVAVRLVMAPPDLELHKASIETKNAVQVGIKNFPMQVNNINPTNKNWVLSEFSFGGDLVIDVTFVIVAEGGEVAIKNAFVLGCVPVDWCEWTPWSKCSVTCGKGKQVRSRICKCPNPDPKLFYCEGPDKQTKKCMKPCCREIIDFNHNSKKINIYIKGPSAGLYNPLHLLRGSPAPIMLTLVNNSIGRDTIFIDFKGKMKSIINVGIDTWKEKRIKLIANPGPWIATKMVNPKSGVISSLFHAPGGQIDKQKGLRFIFAYPTGEIAVNGIFLTVCKKK